MIAPSLLSGALLLLLLQRSACAQSDWPHLDDSPEARVARWAVEQGAELSGFRIGRACPTCLRGVIATADLPEGHVIQKIPMTLALRLGDTTPAIPAEHARLLLEGMHNDPAFNASWHLFWATQPSPDELFTPELYTDQQIEMLQTPELEELARDRRDSTVAVYRGEYSYQAYSPFAEVVPPDRVSLDTFKYMSSLLNSRMFGLHFTGLAEDELVGYLVPVADFFNHDDDPNASRSNDDEHMLIFAIKPIKAGEAITFNYFQGVIHRPDMSMFFFGFVAEREEPLLAAVDLPTFDPDNAFAATPPDDSMYDDPKCEFVKCEFVTWQEYDRLAARLKAAPPSDMQDEAWLENASVADGRLRILLQYRIARKRALRNTMNTIAAHLGGHGRHPNRDRGKAAAASESDLGGIEVAAGEDGSSRVEL